MTLYLENFSLFIKQKPIISSLSLTAHNLCIMGPSGSGKSSLAQAILGIGHHWRAQGCIRFNDAIMQIDNRKYSKNNRRFAYVPQHLALWPHLSAHDTLLLTKKFSNSPIDSLFILDKLQLSHVKHHLPHQMSQGEQQRLALGRALAAAPRLVLLDEPFSALDIITRCSLLAIIKELRNTLNFMTILITHDLSEAFYFNDTLMILKDGHAIWLGPAKSIPYDLPQWPLLSYYQRFYELQERSPCSPFLENNGSFTPTLFL